RVETFLGDHGHLLQPTARGRHRCQTVARHRHNDEVLRRPRSPEECGQFTDQCRVASIRRSLFEFSLTKEGDPVNVWRDVWIGRSFGFRYFHGSELVETADIEVGHAALRRYVR